MAVDEPNLIAVDSPIALGDRPLTVAKGLHFRARQLDARLEALFDEIVEACPSVLGDDLLLVERAWKRLGHWPGQVRMAGRRCKLPARRGPRAPGRGPPPPSKRPPLRLAAGG